MERAVMIKLLTLSFALALAGPAAAFAQGSPEGLTQAHFDQLDTDKNGKVSEAEYRQFMEGAFDKLDTDKNGSLSNAEAGTVLTREQFSIVDRNQNGQLNRQEFMDQVMSDFHRQDQNRDGHLQP